MSPGCAMRMVQAEVATARPSGGDVEGSAGGCRADRCRRAGGARVLAAILVRVGAVAVMMAVSAPALRLLQRGERLLGSANVARLQRLADHGECLRHRTVGARAVVAAGRVAVRLAELGKGLLRAGEVARVDRAGELQELLARIVGVLEAGSGSERNARDGHGHSPAPDPCDPRKGKPSPCRATWVDSVNERLPWPVGASKLARVLIGEPEASSPGHALVSRFGSTQT